jgi:CheY-like chemotaxis protein
MSAVSSRRVLIVDDNLALAENIAEILQIDGHVTDVAGSAEEALAKVEREELDVVVTDYRLPGINGADFVRQFRHNRLHIHALVISAYTDDRTISEARAAGASFMPKPLDFQLLTHFVREGRA